MIRVRNQSIWEFGADLLGVSVMAAIATKRKIVATSRSLVGLDARR